jgi:hypothetical protein
MEKYDLLYLVVDLGVEVCVTLDLTAAADEGVVQLVVPVLGSRGT